MSQAEPAWLPDYYYFSLFLRLIAHFPAKARLAGFIAFKDDGSGGDNWSCKTCKAPVKSSPQRTNSVWSRRLLVEFPQSVKFPPMSDQYWHKIIHLTTTSFHFPTANLVSYTKNIIQHHQMHNNWLKIEWYKNFHFFCYPQLTTLLSGRPDIFSADNSGKPLGDRSSARNPQGGSSQRSPDPTWWGWAWCPLPNYHTPALGLPPRFSALREVRVSFASLPNSLHFSQCLGAWIKLC